MSALAAAPPGAEEQEPQEEPRRLFEIKEYSTRPSTIRIAISGAIELDLNRKEDVDFYNTLEPGKLVTREATFFVASTKTTHRRDSDGNVDAVPQIKSLVVDGLQIAD